MSNQISWIVELRVRPGQLDSFRALTREMVEATAVEPQTMAYERYINEQDETVIVYERYRDAEAAVAHLQSFSRSFGDRFLALVERRRTMVLGDPSDELRSMLDKTGAIYFGFIDGFSRR